jgi:hypothetical protein
VQGIIATHDQRRTFWPAAAGSRTVRSRAPASRQEEQRAAAADDELSGDGSVSDMSPTSKRTHTATSTRTPQDKERVAAQPGTGADAQPGLPSGAGAQLRDCAHGQFAISRAALRAFVVAQPACRPGHGKCPPFASQRSWVTGPGSAAPPRPAWARRRGAGVARRPRRWRRRARAGRRSRRRRRWRSRPRCPRAPPLRPRSPRRRRRSRPWGRGALGLLVGVVGALDGLVEPLEGGGEVRAGELLQRPGGRGRCARPSASAASAATRGRRAGWRSCLAAITTSARP